MLWAQRIKRGKRRSIHAIAVAIAFLAFAVRFFWTMQVQNPFQALYSDMAGYHSRALDFLDGKLQGDPRTYAFFPWGAHVLVGCELWLVGRTNATGIAIIHSIVSSIPAVCVVFFTARVVKSRFWILVAGLFAALWQPSIVHAGYFMSEMWYSAFLVLGTLFILRYLEGRAGAFRAGLCFAIAAVVRPQVLLTLTIAGGMYVATELFRPYWTSLRPKTSIQSWFRFSIPLVLILGFSAYRFHKYTDHWGLVSENGPLNRTFGATHLGRIEAQWWYKGGRYGAWYTPPAKSPVKRGDVISFEGYIADEAILTRIREEHSAREDTWRRIKRMHRNTRMLIYRYIFPEDDVAANGQHENRALLQRTYRTILFYLLPIGVFGLLAALVRKRTRLVGLMLAIHGVTLVVVAALYFAEARMRMPYDPFLITAASAGASTAFVLLRKIWRFGRERAEPTRARSRARALG